MLTNSVRYKTRASSQEKTVSIMNIVMLGQYRLGIAWPLVWLSEVNWMESVHTKGIVWHIRLDGSDYVFTPVNNT